MILVTGATGHLGNVLVRELLKQGESVRVLVYPGERIDSIEDLHLEIVYGDVTNLDSLNSAFEGMDSVFHMAGIVSILPDYSELLEKVNVRGTMNVIQACLDRKVRRLVYTSSIHALAEVPQGMVIDEEIPFSPEKAIGAYGKSKARASLAVLEAVAGGLDAILVCPTGVIGPYDFRPSRMGRLLLKAFKKGFQGIPEGYYDFVDVRDIALGEILAWRQGRSGETYILSGEKISLKSYLKLIQIAVGREISIIPIPLWLCKIGAFFSTLIYKINKKDPLVTKESLTIVRSNCSISCEKAKIEIGFSPRPIFETVKDTLFWFSRAGKLFLQRHRKRLNWEFRK